jgi:hypothetical protein
MVISEKESTMTAATLTLINPTDQFLCHDGLHRTLDEVEEILEQLLTTL